MSRKSWLNYGLAAAVIILIVAAVTAFWYISTLPQHISNHETLVLGQNTFSPGSTAAMRVLVNDLADGKPLADAEVSLSLRPRDNSSPAQTLFTGRSDADGVVNVSFTVPADAAADQTLIVETRSSLGTDRIEREVTIQRDYRVLLTTDKPLYQPGQIIHIRALALSAFDLQAADAQNLTLEVADGKGNKVFRKNLVTSEYGAAWADFQLAPEVNSGNYKISATLGNATSEKTVTVEYYVLPKFDLTLETERSYYQPGQQVKGSLQADYFFGKPVSEGLVTLEVYTFDVQQNLFLTLQGQTDADGHFEFEFTLPEFIAGSDLEGGLGRVYLQANVVDQAEHRELGSLSLPVSESGLVVEAALESGRLIPNLENILYVLISTPDGSPAAAQLTVSLAGEQLNASTNEYGLAEIRFTPKSNYLEAQITAQAENGARASQLFTFSGEATSEFVLLRTDRPVYQVGQTMTLDVYTTASSGLVYLDIVRSGQTVSTRSLKLEGSRTSAAIDLTPDLTGTLELHAYRILYGGTIVRDTRLVVVNNADELMVNLTAGQDTYKPGDTATLNLQVDGMDGSAVQSAVGLAIVDESVFALAEQDPGFARLYFMLEAEILTPRYDIHGLSVPDLMYGISSNIPELKELVATAARASLASAPVSTFSLTANSHDEAIRKAYQAQDNAYGILTLVFASLFILVSLGMVWLQASGVWRDKALGRSALVMLGVLAFLIAIFIFLVTNNLPDWARSVKYFISDFFGLLTNYLAVSLTCLGGGVLISWNCSAGGCHPQ